MAAESDSTAPTARGGWLPVAGLVAVLLVSLIWFVHPYYEPVNDGSLYILTARSILEGDGYTYQGVPFIIRPPGFAVFLAGVLAVFGTDFFVLNLIGGLFGVACIACMFALFRERLGTWTCLAMCAFIWTSSAWQRLCNQVLSDVPGAALMFACLLIDRWAARCPGWRRHVVLGLAISISMYFRSLNVLLIPAVLCARGAEHFLAKDDARPAWRWKPVLAAVLVPVLLQVPWSLRNAAAEVPVPPEHVYLHSYSAAMWHTSAADPASPSITAAQFFARVPERLAELLPTLGSRMESAIPDTTHSVLGLIALGLWAVALVRRRGTAEFLAGGVVVLLSIYFAFKPRLALPAYLLLLPAAIDTLQWGLARVSGERLARGLVTAALLVGTVTWYKPLGEWPFLREEHEAYLEVARVVERRFPGDEPLAAPHGWHYQVYFERPVYSMRIIATRLNERVALERTRQRGVVGAVVGDGPDESLYLAWFRTIFVGERALPGHFVFKVP